jgi:hypothetical protein
MGRVDTDLRGIYPGLRLFWMVVAALVMALVFDVACAAEKQTYCVRYISEVQFTDLVKDQTPAAVDAGKGLTLELSAVAPKEGIPGPQIGRRGLTVLDNGKISKVLPESFYVSYSCVEKDLTTYWVVEEYTGGMHCCNRYHFFSKSGSDRPIRYLGATDGTMNPRDNPWVCKGNDIYFEDSDIRFVYFHIDYASSRLYIPRFYHLAPSSLIVSNRPFKDVYRDEIAELNLEIDEKTGTKKTKPYGILAGNEDRHFSDELGQLLVQKMILYLFAGENQKAWGTFIKDVKSHYKTTEGAALLKKEIEKMLREGPY